VPGNKFEDDRRGGRGGIKEIWMVDMDFFLLIVSDWIRYLFRETLALVDYTMV
jgi:hypothetical protein